MTISVDLAFSSTVVAHICEFLPDNFDNVTMLTAKEQGLELRPKEMNQLLLTLQGPTIIYVVLYCVANFTMSVEINWLYLLSTSSSSCCSTQNTLSLLSQVSPVAS